MDSERLVSADLKEEDAQIEYSLRPRYLAEYIGQSKVKEHMSIFIEAAKQRGEALDHVLLYGPPGLGKTTLSMVIANELGANIRMTSGPAITHAGDLAAILTNLSAGDVLFIDEIHRLSAAVEEILYPAMEDYALDIIIGKGPSARSIRIDLPRFTLIGATTKAGMLTSPLRDRFGVINRLDLYNVDELEDIIRRSADILRVNLNGEAARAIARRARGTPRVANRLLKRVRDYAQIRAQGNLTGPVADEALDVLEIDRLGLDDLDRRVLRAMIEKFSGGPVGIETIAVSVNEEAATLEDICEPYLIQLGFLARTPRGRVVTRAGYDHIGLRHPEAWAAQQQSLEL